MPHDPIAAKSPFDHNLPALCHHASRKKTASASKTLLNPEKQAFMDGHLVPIHKQQVFGIIAENALFVRARPGGFRYTLASSH
ncbi:hypothetical protein [Sinorhizobium meliloti]|nr:hypothetical protein [Sinorhizobium meliloti]